MAARPCGTCRTAAAGTMNGPCTAQWPPPLGTNRLMMMDETKPQNGSVCALETRTNRVAITPARPVVVMMPMMPP